MVKIIMEGSVRALVDMGWEGLKLDSCSQFNNLSWWNSLINKTSPIPFLQENCHQGGYVPGITLTLTLPLSQTLTLTLTHRP